MTTPFPKPSLSIADQIALLEQRGLVIADQALATHCLKHISYYRLRAYWYYFEIDPTDGSHLLQGGTTLEQVLSLYDFDRKLRLLINDGIERIEVAARGSWAHYQAMVHGPHGYLDDWHYSNADQFQRNVAQLTDEVERSHDTFIEHYNTKYGDPPFPPVWMVAEVMSFGLLSKFISLLGTRASRQGIARPLGLDERIFTSFLHHLGMVRNVCAHHGRLWNRRLTVTAMLPQNPPELAKSIDAGSPRRIYNTLVIMIYLMRNIAPVSDWGGRVVELLDSHPTGDLSAMGAPQDWRERPVWQSIVAKPDCA